MIKKIPVVDVAPLCSDEEAEGLNDVVEKIGEACRDWGFFQVVNHGVSDVLIDRVWDETRRFFSLPRQVKLSITRTKDNPRGYYDRELTKNARDLKEVFDFANVPFPDLPDEHPKNRAAVDGQNQWPATLPTFKPTMTCDKCWSKSLATWLARFHRKRSPGVTRCWGCRSWHWPGCGCW